MDDAAPIRRINERLYHNDRRLDLIEAALRDLVLRYQELKALVEGPDNEKAK